ncbi:MAG: hypothetical protein KAS76_02170 [Thermoplasmatales archaeon]|nr:hypothetical protein [Thermoplasmatales archaeon]MCK4996481.1 hypothetical protein [Thermoplasmatales archaeon]
MAGIKLLVMSLVCILAGIAYGSSELAGLGVLGLIVSILLLVFWDLDLRSNREEQPIGISYYIMCKQCGVQNPTDYTFCKLCGNNIHMIPKKRYFLY